MNIPNFLIVGAPRCGTTSLYNYLKIHPDIFFCQPKEPKFITSQFFKFPFNGNGDNRIEKGFVTNYDKYCELFKNVKNEKALGEASPDTLYYYKQSIPIIKKYFGDVKIIISLRNPIDRAFSHYSNHINAGRESLSFEEALDQENHRIRNNWLVGWYYVKVGFYFKQVEAFLSSFSNVKVIMFDDLKSNKDLLLKDIYQFLNVDTNYIPFNSDVKFNISGTPRFKSWHNFLTKSNIIRSSIFLLLRKTVSPEKRRMYREKLISKNLVKTEMKLETRNRLVKLFKKDINLLGDLLSKDLSHWLK